MEKFFIVWNQKGGHPKIRHANEWLARAEAERLASKHPGEEFFVMESVGVVKGNVKIDSLGFERGQESPRRCKTDENGNITCPKCLAEELGPSILVLSGTECDDCISCKDVSDGGEGWVKWDGDGNQCPFNDSDLDNIETQHRNGTFSRSKGADHQKKLLRMLWDWNGEHESGYDVTYYRFINEKN